MFRFCIRYRKGNEDADRNHQVKKSWHWEVGWTAASLVVFVGLYAWGAEFYLREHKPPGNATDIYVVGKQWMWKFAASRTASARSTRCTCRSAGRCGW